MFRPGSAATWVGASLLCFATAVAVGTPQKAALPNFHEVNDHVFRGGQPSEEGFKSLASKGVKTVIDLREPDEHSLSRERGWVESDGMRYVSVPLQGMSAPPNAAVSKILTILNDPEQGPVFVHCKRGADRTGTIMACYRIWHDHWQNRNALEEARGFGMRFTERAMRHYVSQYKGESEPALQQNNWRK